MHKILIFIQVFKNIFRNAEGGTIGLITDDLIFPGSKKSQKIGRDFFDTRHRENLGHRRIESCQGNFQDFQSALETFER